MSFHATSALLTGHLSAEHGGAAATSDTRELSARLQTRWMMVRAPCGSRARGFCAVLSARTADAEREEGRTPLHKLQYSTPAATQDAIRRRRSDAVAACRHWLPALVAGIVCLCASVRDSVRATLVTAVRASHSLHECGVRAPRGQGGARQHARTTLGESAALWPGRAGPGPTHTRQRTVSTVLYSHLEHFWRSGTGWAEARSWPLLLG